MESGVKRKLNPLHHCRGSIADVEARRTLFTGRGAESVQAIKIVGMDAQRAGGLVVCLLERSFDGGAFGLVARIMSLDPRDDGSLQSVFQFADVSRSCIRAKKRARLDLAGVRQGRAVPASQAEKNIRRNGQLALEMRTVDLRKAD